MFTRRKITLLLVLLMLLATANSGFAMNDTDGVVGRGLFPFEKGTHQLAVSAEEIQVVVDRKRIQSIWTYQIRNMGNDGVFQFGAACSVGLKWPSPCGQVYVDGRPVESEKHIGYLVDEGPFVKTRTMPLEDVENCYRGDPDGTICGHEWITMPIRFAANQVRQVVLAQTIPLTFSRLVEEMTGNLYLYTEKFWAGDVIPRITLGLGLQGGELGVESFLPHGEHAQYSIPPSRAENGMIIWRFENYRPNKSPMSYVFWIVHPFAVDNDAIREAYESMIRRKHSSSETNR